MCRTVRQQYCSNEVLQYSIYVVSERCSNDASICSTAIATISASCKTNTTIHHRVSGLEELKPTKRLFPSLLFSSNLFSSLPIYYLALSPKSISLTREPFAET